MIADTRVLQPDFVPSDVQIQNRDPEVNHLSNALDPITRDEPSETAFLVGASGAGKTCIALFTLLRETVLGINTQYVNRWDDNSAFSIETGSRGR